MCAPLSLPSFLPDDEDEDATEGHRGVQDSRTTMMATTETQAERTRAKKRRMAI